MLSAFVLLLFWISSLRPMAQTLHDIRKSTSKIALMLATLDEALAMPSPPTLGVQFIWVRSPPWLPRAHWRSECAGLRLWQRGGLWLLGELRAVPAGGAAARGRCRVRAEVLCTVCQSHTIPRARNARARARAHKHTHTYTRARHAHAIPNGRKHARARAACRSARARKGLTH
jgi:hypothetical protein